MYFEVKNSVEKEKQENRLRQINDKIMEQRDLDQKFYDNCVKISEYKGKRKYTYSLIKDLEYGKKALELSKTAQKIGAANIAARPQKSDSALWAGIANGIVGPGAAIATAYDIEKKNIESEKNVESIRKSGRKLYNESINIQNNLPSVLANEEKMLNYIEDRLYDDRNQTNKLELLNINNIKYEINDGFNFVIKFNYNLTKPVKIINSDAILDGTLEINVYDIENELVATGLYNADGFKYFDLNYSGSKKFDFDSTGFNGRKNVSCKCISKDYKKIDKDIKYNIEIKPYYLWIIEK